MTSPRELRERHRLPGGRLDDLDHGATSALMPLRVRSPCAKKNMESSPSAFSTSCASRSSGRSAQAQNSLGRCWCSRGLRSAVERLGSLSDCPRAAGSFISFVAAFQRYTSLSEVVSALEREPPPRRRSRPARSSPSLYNIVRCTSRVVAVHVEVLRVRSLSSRRRRPRQAPATNEAFSLSRVSGPAPSRPSRGRRGG